MSINRQELQAEALANARGGMSVTNYPTIYRGFIDKGIAESEIAPRVNVFTFNAWIALGRRVRKGEHGVRVITVRKGSKTVTDDATGEQKTVGYSRPWSAVVFHVSQTDPL